MNGAILYRGPSLLDGSPIVAIVTGLRQSSGNAKTGDMLQTWILPDTGAYPVEHVRAGTDRSVCGTCPFASGNGCYVQVGRAPHAVYGAYLRGVYPDATGDDYALIGIGAGSYVRLGAYGDPAAVPVDVWESLLTFADGHTGYTHQWRSPRVQAYRHLVQASCETAADITRAQSDGWGCFAVVPASLESTLPAGAIPCPASAEQGKRTTCADCRLCDGQSGHVVHIRPHGSGAAKASAVSVRRSTRHLPTLELAQ